MPTLFQSAIWLSIGLEVLFLLKLCYARLLRQYEWLALMLATGLFRDLLLGLIAPDSQEYRINWFVTLVPYVIAQIGVAVSAYFRLSGLYTGIGRFAGWLYLFAVLAVLSGCVVANHIVGETANEPYINFGLLVERSIALILSGSTVLVIAFLARFPSPLQRMPRNLITHFALLITFFGLTAVFQLILGRVVDDQETSRTIEEIFFILGDICYLVWMIMLNSKGEVIIAWPRMEPGMAAKVRALNTELVDFAKQTKVSTRA